MRRKMKIRFIYTPFILIFIVFVYNEYLIYWHVLSKCDWPDSEFISNADSNHQKYAKIMILADTHLLGSRNGHWFDKLRREWQQYRSFQTLTHLLEPDYTIILGDLTDEGKWCSDKEWEYYVKRSEELFTPSNKKTKLMIVVGNHDIGFHYSMSSHLIQRFNRSFTPQFIHFEHDPAFNLYFVFVNSMSLENDRCHFCEKAQRQLKFLNRTFNCIKYKNCTNNDNSREYSKPIIFTHFPLHRTSDSICPVDIDSEPPEKAAPFKPKFDCLSLEATRQLIDMVNPRLIFSGHTHYSCYNEVHGVPEFTIPSFSWRNIKTPSVLLLKVSESQHVATKCYLPSEIFVFNAYTAFALFLFVYFLYQIVIRRCYLFDKNKIY